MTPEQQLQLEEDYTYCLALDISQAVWQARDCDDRLPYACLITPRKAIFQNTRTAEPEGEQAETVTKVSAIDKPDIQTTEAPTAMSTMAMTPEMAAMTTEQAMMTTMEPEMITTEQSEEQEGMTTTQAVEMTTPQEGEVTVSERQMTEEEEEALVAMTTPATILSEQLSTGEPESMFDLQSEVTTSAPVDASTVAPETGHVDGGEGSTEVVEQIALASLAAYGKHDHSNDSVGGRWFAFVSALLSEF